MPSASSPLCSPGRRTGVSVSAGEEEAMAACRAVNPPGASAPSTPASVSQSCAPQVDARTPDSLREVLTPEPRHEGWDVITGIRQGWAPVPSLLAQQGPSPAPPQAPVSTASHGTPKAGVWSQALRRGTAGHLWALNWGAGRKQAPVSLLVPGPHNGRATLPTVGGPLHRAWRYPEYCILFNGSQPDRVSWLPKQPK